MVGYVPYPLNDSSFLIQPTLPELQRLAEVMGSLPTAVVTQAAHLHERGVSMRQVSKQLGVSRTALRRNFREMGVGV